MNYVKELEKSHDENRVIPIKEKNSIHNYYNNELSERLRSVKKVNGHLIDTMTTIPLPFDVYSYSSHSGTYHPHHITENKPSEQASRWSSGTHDQDQFICLRFSSPVVASKITFGKFHRAHVCNLKEFKIYGGFNHDNMMELLHTGLKNDTEPETFDLRIHFHGLVFPIQYLKIVPLSTFGANFNYSIWYIQVQGIQDHDLLKKIVTQYQRYQEIQTTRLCLKHFRQRNMMHIFRLLQERTKVELEHPLLTELHSQLVMNGDFDGTERLLTQLLRQGVFQHYAKNAPYKATWHRIWATNQDGDSPCPRGGHQMCIDIIGRRIYLLGGWDGHKDLSDFWCYDIQADQWNLLSADTLEDGGPSPRSCHKISFDPKSRSIFVLGKYVEYQTAQDHRLESDFYRYFCDHNKWMKISDNTAKEKGPGLIFDHQMCVDEEGQILYVFGGRKVNYESTTTMHTYSGLYSYNIGTNTWRLIQADGGGNSPIPTVTNTTPTSVSSTNKNDSESCIETSIKTTMKSRVGHSMLFDPLTRHLYIFAGQRVKDYLSDLFAYSIDANQVTELSQDYSKEAGPDAGYTQRATIDIEKKEIYVLSGYLQNQGCDVVKSGLWVYSIEQNRWTKVYQNENRDPDYWKRMKHVEPCPRFAHQMVYDQSTNTQYIFGGNPGDRECANKRLDDFWQLRLVRPDPDDILRRSIYLVRMQQLKEKCINHPISSIDDPATHTLDALDYLRSKLTPLVNHDNPEEVHEFRQLCARLCLSPENAFFSTLDECKDLEQDIFSQRNQVFEGLLEYIPDEMKEPTEQLLDVVKLV
ncbi:Muskelin N-terminus-domain-containing protein [Halteromyces radiatus]|uniref:Muskelin N-terminus-domain-containing protein n=1 Tax=Halteromyces radiatus TaxID=101107 RepID=UPI00222055A0|nr:Muskelin N-terminus-domain-containing protein [Halteromyces radiatus]KAI8078641.1 Muskelin N-terminus-domain-containing protein [Halteromyces radiatus]